ncbi:hypothetical protein ACFYU8_17935 [Brevibacillus sp. NPDC003359]|uniref:hypothetical protein n=1 Tax=unclassified Brevibacillus TaxID=2684853 RepID=UPI0036B1F91A
MDREKKIKMTRISSILALIVVLVTLAILLFLDYLRDRDNFENIDEIRQTIQNEKLAKPDPFTITYEQIQNQAQHMKESDIPLDENVGKHDPEQAKLFKDRSYVIKYLFTLAIEGEVQAFFEQFDPNTMVKDFPNINTQPEEQNQALNSLTRNHSLTNIRILKSELVPNSKDVSVLVELVYSDQSRSKVWINMVKIGDEHSSHASWYITSSIHDLIKHIES